MTKEEILEGLKEILLYEDERNREAVLNCSPETELVADLGLASVSLLYLVISIEEQFGIRFDSVGVNDFKTVGNVVDYIYERLKKTEGTS